MKQMQNYDSTIQYIVEKNLSYTQILELSQKYPHFVYQDIFFWLELLHRRYPEYAFMRKVIRDPDVVFRELETTYLVTIRYPRGTKSFRSDQEKIILGVILGVRLSTSTPDMALSERLRIVAPQREEIGIGDMIRVTQEHFTLDPTHANMAFLYPDGQYREYSLVSLDNPIQELLEQVLESFGITITSLI